VTTVTYIKIDNVCSMKLLELDYSIFTCSVFRKTGFIALWYSSWLLSRDCICA